MVHTSPLLSFLRALRRTGIGHTGSSPPRPILAALTLLVMLLRHGVSLYTLAAWQARRQPQTTALIDDDGALTYRELQALADKMLANLAPLVDDQVPEYGYGVGHTPPHPCASRRPSPAGGEGEKVPPNPLYPCGRGEGGPPGPEGVRGPPRERVGLLARNGRDFVAALLACGRLGLKVTLLNTTFSADQLVAVARTQHLTLLLHDAEMGQTAAGTRWVSLADLLTSRPFPRRLAPRVGQLIVLTSGSTGTPKAVQRSLALNLSRLWTLLPLLTELLTSLNLQAGSRTLLPLPLFHGHGLATLGMCLGLGAPLVLTGRSSAGQLWNLLQNQGISVLVVVPTLLYRLMQEPRAAPHLRTIICGSAPLAPELATRTLDHFGDILFNVYGSTEAGLISLANPADLRVAPASVGRVLPGIQIGLVSNQVGPVTVQSPLLSTTAALNTGDLGQLDSAGRLTLLGRQDDLIICGGENVYPEMLEERLKSLPYVLDAAVRGVPDTEYGQAIEAFLVRQMGVDQIDLEADLTRLLPRTLRPRQVYWCDTLPRNALGKLLRHELAVTPSAENAPPCPASAHW